MKSGVRPARSRWTDPRQVAQRRELQALPRSPAAPRWRRCSQSRVAAATGRPSARGTRATPGRTPRAGRARAARQEWRAVPCRCTRGRRRSRPSRSARNAISVAPSPGRRSTGNPRASSSCANISASRYDSPNGFEATTTGAAGPRGLASTSQQERAADAGSRPAPVRDGAAPRTYAVAGAAAARLGGATCSTAPACITATRSARRNASARSWVTSSDVSSSSRANSRNVVCRSARVMASSAPNGSSRSTTSGLRGERPRHRHPLALSSRQLAAASGRRSGRLEPDQHAAPGRRRLRARASPRSQGTSATLRRTRQCGQQSAVLRDVADPAPQRDRIERRRIHPIRRAPGPRRDRPAG